MHFQVTITIAWYVCYYIEVVQRNENEAKQALLQDQQRKLARNMDELKDQVEHQSKTLHSQIVAAQS